MSDDSHTAKLAGLREEFEVVQVGIGVSIREILEPEEAERAGLYPGMDVQLFAMRACVRIHELEELLAEKERTDE